MQKNSKIAILGEKGSYHHLAVIKASSNKKIKILSCKSFDEIKKMVAANKVPYGVIAIQNNLVGSINNPEEFDNDILVIKKIWIEISHQLITSRNNKEKLKDISNIKTIYSHKKAIEQCSNFIKSNPHLEIKEVSDTATAVKMVCSKPNINKEVAAIGSSLSAELYGGYVQRKNIQNEQGKKDKPNQTQFAVITNKLVELRKKIDEIDKSIIELVASRQEVSKDISIYKGKHSAQITDENREGYVLNSRAKSAKKLSLSSKLSNQLFSLLIKESKKYQQKMNTLNKK